MKYGVQFYKLNNKIMYKIQDTPCQKCGGDTSIKYERSENWGSKQTGLKRTCSRCGFSEFIESLDEIENNMQEAREANEL